MKFYEKYVVIIWTIQKYTGSGNIKEHNLSKSFSCWKVTKYYEVCCKCFSFLFACSRYYAELVISFSVNDE
jgi:hypothetical protein